MRNILGYTAIFLAFLSYVPYVRDLFKRKTKPHAFSWLIWGLLTLVVFLVQLDNGGGLASWVAGITGLLSLFIFFLSLWWGEKRITTFDWLCLIGALLALSIWVFVDSPALAIVLASFIDVLGFAPTFRKSYHRPFEETLATPLISSVKHGLTLIALDTKSFTTTFYPISLFISTLAFVAMLLYQRKLAVKTMKLKRSILWP